MKVIRMKSTLLYILLLVTPVAHAASSSTTSTSDTTQETIKRSNPDSAADEVTSKREHLEQVTLPQSLVLFDGSQIIQAFKMCMLQLSGKIIAAYYNFTSDEITTAWIARRHIQAFRAADAAGDMQGMINASQELTSSKQDVLIVDNDSLTHPACKTRLDRLVKAGITVYIRDKKRNNSRYEKMHLKFMVICDEFDTPRIVLSGSFNPTEQAIHNWEDLKIETDPVIIQQYVDIHRQIVGYCTPYRVPSSEQEDGIPISAPIESYETKIGRLVILGGTYVEGMSNEQLDAALQQLSLTQRTRRQ